VGSEIWAEAHGQAGAGGPVPCPEPYEIDVVIGSAGDICLRKAAPGYLRPRRLRPTHASPESTTPRFKALFVEPVGRTSPHQAPVPRYGHSPLRYQRVRHRGRRSHHDDQLVPKRSNPWEGRLVIDAPPVNRAQQRPGDMDIPSMRQVISRILSCSYFRARIAGRRGAIHEVRLKRLPMGWSHSPRLAQQTSNTLISAGDGLSQLGVARLDDFIVGGRTEFHVARNCFRGRLKKYRVEVDDDSLSRRPHFPHSDWNSTLCRSSSDSARRG
jgi:hypothetical protein